MSEPVSAEDVWRAVLTGHDPALAQKRRRNRRIPRNPRCKTCLMPFAGVGGRLLRLAGKGRSKANPHFCNACEQLVETYPGGAEVELSLLFADVRGSTALAEGMTSAEFSRLMNKFYAASNQVIIDSDGFIEKLIGDEVVAYYLPFIGPQHPRQAIEAARELLKATGHADSNGPWLPVGAGVHTDTAWVGVVGSGELADINALGDAVNITARLASLARMGEVLISEQAYARAAPQAEDLERRRVEKGRSEPLDVRVLRVVPEVASRS